MWLALKLLASGAFDAAMKGLSAALEWLLSDWRNMALAGTGAALVWTLVFTVPGLRADLADARADLTAEQAAHLGTVNAFLAASEQAQKDAEANAQRVAREQEIITDAIVSDYRGDIAALRARFDRLRAGSPRAAAGGADAAVLSAAGNAPGRADAPTGQDRLPSAVGLSLDDALIASEQALQLDALIDWVEAQSSVRFTPEGGR